MNLRDAPHTGTIDSDVSAHRGQALPGRTVPEYGARRTSPTGLAVTIGLHLLLVALYFHQPDTPEKKAAPPDGSEVVYVAPLSKPAPPPQKSATRKPSEPVKTAPPVRPRVERLPDTITIPDEKPVEIAKAEPVAEPKPKPEEITPEMDMTEYIARRRQARGAVDPSTSTEETEAARGARRALANVASVNNRGYDDDNETGGLFSIGHRTFNTVELRFRGWNPNFKRRWLTQVTVEQGNEPDLQTALVKKMIEMIRKTKTGDFIFQSDRLGKDVELSARVEDTAELQAFLMEETKDWLSDHPSRKRQRERERLF